jgi:hypothetical protein
VVVLVVVVLVFPAALAGVGLEAGFVVVVGCWLDILAGLKN